MSAQFGKWKYVYILKFKRHYRLEKVFQHSVTNICHKPCIEISSYLEHDSFLVRFVYGTGTNTWKVLNIMCPRYVWFIKIQIMFHLYTGVNYWTIHPFNFLCFYYLLLVRKIFHVKCIAGNTVIKLCEQGKLFQWIFLFYFFFAICIVAMWSGVILCLFLPLIILKNWAFSSRDFAF